MGQFISRRSVVAIARAALAPVLGDVCALTAPVPSFIVGARTG